MNDVIFIDVRSPVEFMREKIPGAVNIPLFDNEEHRELGKIYREKGSAAARKKGLEFVSPKLSSLVEMIDTVSDKKTPVIYCWRGGLRSLSLYQILYLTGVSALRLKGGYKAYRKHVHKSLKDYRLPSPVILHGLTGTGKTLIIESLIERGYPAIDLEGLALHRGSAFGKIGFKEERSQKDFEGLLLRELEKHRDADYIIFEKEGKKIGPVFLPFFLTEALENGTHLLLVAPLEKRVERIIGEYIKGEVTPDQKKLIVASIKAITPYIGNKVANELIDYLNKNNYYDIVMILCRDYYDKLYRDARPGRYLFSETVDSSSVAIATEKILSFSENLKSTKEVIS